MKKLLIALIFAFALFLIPASSSNTDEWICQCDCGCNFYTSTPIYICPWDHVPCICFRKPKIRL
jgi:hypothetical protein